MIELPIYFIFHVNFLSKKGTKFIYILKHRKQHKNILFDVVFMLMYFILSVMNYTIILFKITVI